MCGTFSGTDICSSFYSTFFLDIDVSRWGGVASWHGVSIQQLHLFMLESSFFVRPQLVAGEPDTVLQVQGFVMCTRPSKVMLTFAQDVKKNKTIKTHSTK